MCSLVPLTLSLPVSLCAAASHSMSMDRCTAPPGNSPVAICIIRLIPPPLLPFLPLQLRVRSFIVHALQQLAVSHSQHLTQDALVTAAALLQHSATFATPLQVAVVASCCF